MVMTRPTPRHRTASPNSAYPRAARSFAIGISALTAAMVLAACGGRPGTPTGSPSDTGGTGVVGTAAPTTAPAPTYPATAQAYSQAVLDAWHAGQSQTLTALATPTLQTQLTGITPQPNMNWHYSRCEGAAGSSYCFYFNDNGDKVRMQLTNALLGQADAAVALYWEPTSYPSESIAYVRAFVAAWEDGNVQRMGLLANQNEVQYFTHYTPPEPDYLTCGYGAAGSTYVRIYSPAGLNYVVRVVNQTLGQAQAIADHIDPPTPPACG
jgi:hypothetical protein